MNLLVSQKKYTGLSQVFVASYLTSLKKQVQYNSN